MRGISAAVVVSVSVVSAVCGSAATAKADVKCDENSGPNPAAPELYRAQYDSSVADVLTKDFATYRSAVASNDPSQINDAAGPLYSEISVDVNMFATQKLFGCYSPAVLASLQRATDALAPTYNNINSAVPGEVPGLVSRAKPQEKAFIDALNAYSSQFGGQRVPPS